MIMCKKREVKEIERERERERYGCGWTLYQVQGNAGMPCIWGCIADVIFALFPFDSINFFRKKNHLHSKLKSFFYF
jgi:hypothetical protein